MQRIDGSLNDENAFNHVTLKAIRILFEKTLTLLDAKMHLTD